MQDGIGKWGKDLIVTNLDLNSVTLVQKIRGFSLFKGLEFISGI